MRDETETHPSFPQPDDSSQVIWRYMDTSKFEWLLHNQRLFLPTADQLGDPLEGSAPPGQLDWWEREAEKADSEEARNVIAHNRKFFAHFAQVFRGRYYVSCWHMNAHENYAMWRCYTNTNEAVAIKTTYAALRKALPRAAYMGVIRYIDYSIDRLPWGNMFEYIMHKDTYYRYEAEVRVVAVPPATEKLGLDDFLKDHFSLADQPDFLVYAPPVNPTEFIHGIVLHPEASEEFAERIRKLCVEQGLPEPVPSRGESQPRF